VVRVKLVVVDRRVVENFMWCGKRMARWVSVGVISVLVPTVLQASGPAVGFESAEVGSGPALVESREVFSPGGEITRVDTPVDAEPRGKAGVLAPAEVSPMKKNGPSGERLDLVFVGDGYTRAELAQFARDAEAGLAAIMSTQPFGRSRTMVNAWRVDVVSPEPGVDNDPEPGILRDTALDVELYCTGAARLLCVNEDKARQYAAMAPEADQIIAVANSSTFGGAGGAVATYSGSNPTSPQIAIHELGHSLGGLADEYDYDGEGCYSDPAPEQPNISIYSEDEMRQRRTKWYKFLSKPTPDGGLIDTFEGAYYVTCGIYRPSDVSLMASLGSPEFNIPSRRALRAAVKRYAKPQ
jgi:hypothetical protein